jgi:hypothetical protein
MGKKDNRVKVRFHLGAGEHYKHWKIEYPNGDYQFINPEKQNMVLHGCQLHNRKGTAEGIHAGGEKVVCAWVWCDEVRMYSLTSTGVPVSYNPRVYPHWMYEGMNADNMTFDRLQTIGNKLISI